MLAQTLLQILVLRLLLRTQTRHSESEDGDASTAHKRPEVPGKEMADKSLAEGDASADTPREAPVHRG